MFIIRYMKCGDIWRVVAHEGSRKLEVLLYCHSTGGPHDSDFLSSLNVGLRIPMTGSNKAFFFYCETLYCHSTVKHCIAILL